MVAKQVTDAQWCALRCEDSYRMDRHTVHDQALSTGIYCVPKLSVHNVQGWICRVMLATRNPVLLIIQAEPKKL
jgi:hypothetical protein